MLSASDVGALHRRERWFLLGYSKHNGLDAFEEQRGFGQAISDDKEREDKAGKFKGAGSPSMLADTKSEKCSGLSGRKEARLSTARICDEYETIVDWQEAVSNVCRTVDGVSSGMDRIKALGNAVVPLQAREAFKILSGMEQE